MQTPTHTGKQVSMHTHPHVCTQINFVCIARPMPGSVISEKSTNAHRTVDKIQFSHNNNDSDLHQFYPIYTRSHTYAHIILQKMERFSATLQIAYDLFCHVINIPIPFFSLSHFFFFFLVCLKPNVDLWLFEFTLAREKPKINGKKNNNKINKSVIQPKWGWFFKSSLFDVCFLFLSYVMKKTTTTDVSMYWT